MISATPPASPVPVGAGDGPVDLDRAPITVAWETTRACALACRHCRAAAIPRREPDELDTDQGLALIDEVADAGTRVLVLTGGDPLRREDLETLVAHGAARGLRVGVSPAVTGLLRRRRLASLVEAGAAAIHLSLDGAAAATHDGLRGVRGSFDRSLAACAWIGELDARLQVATSVTRETVADLPALAEHLGELDVWMWSLFFLVPTGRARAMTPLDADEQEAALRWLATVADDLPFGVRTTAAPTYRRIRDQLGRPAPPAGRANDGKGFVFVSARGAIQPSGFLPLTVGHTGRDDLGAVYRDAPLLRALRDSSALGEPCGRCDWADVCGGSRARAWALTGDPLAADPTCPLVAHHPDPA